jgi:hypothetical protein
MTLIEYAKTAFNGGEVKRASVISQFARASAWLAALPFQNIQGGAYTYDIEGALPGIAFRGINESYTASTGLINPQAEALRIGGGDLDVDQALVKMYGTERRAQEETMKIKALAAELTRVLIKGDSTTEPREFDGLQGRLVVGGNQVVSAGTTDAGDPGSMFLLDTMISRVAGPNKRLWMNRTMALRLTQAARTSTVGGHIDFAVDDFGRQVTRYNGIPIDVPYPENDGTEPLAFDEQGDIAGSPAGSTSTSIYCVSLGDGYMRGVQNGSIEVRDLGEIDDSPVLRTRVEWLVSLVLENPKAAARYGGISNAAFVA